MADNKELTVDEESKEKVQKVAADQTGDKEEKPEDSPKLLVRYTPIFDSGTKMSLFGSGLYYANLGNALPYVKTLLLLYSLSNVVKGAYPNFISRNKKHGTVETVSKAYVYLLGGILWRMRQDKDPIYGDEKYNLGNYKEDTLFISDSDNVYKFYVNRLGSQQQNYVKIIDLFDGQMPDYHVQNILISKFVKYAATCLTKIINNLEIYPGTKEQKEQYAGSRIPFELIINNSDLDKRVRQILEKLSQETGSQNNGTNPSEQPTENKEETQSDGDEAWIENFNVSLGENFRAKYYTGAIADDKGFHLFIKDDNPAQEELVALCTEECVIMDTSYKRFSQQPKETASNTPTDVYVRKDIAISYLKGITNTLEDIVNNKNVATNTETSIQESSENTEEEEQDFTRDIAVPIYLYLKMLWDKWLCDIPKDRKNSDFYVKNFYKNFVFTDTFYRNIESRLTINCQVLLDIFDNNNFSNKDITVFKFISDLTTQHHCLFVAVPDFISGLASTSLNDEEYDKEGIRSQEESMKALKDLFKPVPYRQVDKLRNNNKFVVIYVPKLSETPSSMNGYKQDWFNVWSYNDDTDAQGLNADPMYKSITGPKLPKVLEEISLSVNTGSKGDAEAVSEGNDKPLNNLTPNNTPHTNAEVVANSIYGEYDPRRYGYYVPAFGLAYGRQNNHLFKNVQLNMETPIITSAAINTLAHIAQKGASSAHRIAYVGQDIYPVFSNYSYICEFDMMGNAQIQPLMYFQLLNVPMWRGTYMIFNVTHTMKPGDMTTHVKAMKLSNRAVPYSNAWFTKNLNYKPSELEAYLACFDQIAGGNVTTTSGGGNSFAGYADGNFTSYTGGAFDHVGERVDINAIPLADNKNITAIVVHCTANWDDTGASVDAKKIHEMHKSDRDFKGIGYNFVIKTDGTIEMGRGTNISGAHAGKEYNSRSVGISYVGGYKSENGKHPTVKDKKGNEVPDPKCAVDTRTEAQKRSMVSLIKGIMKKYNIKEIVGHRDTPNGKGRKACPCFDAIQEYAPLLNGTSSSSSTLTNSSTSNEASVSKTRKRKANGGTHNKSEYTVNGKNDQKTMSEQMVTVTLGDYNKTVTVHKKVATDVENIFKEIKRTMPDFIINYVGGYNYRNVRGSNRLSMHAYGVAIDVNPSFNPHWDMDGNPAYETGYDTALRKKWTRTKSGCKDYNGLYDKNKCIWSWDHPVVKAFQKYGWGWGGSFGDTMHFSATGR